MAKKSRIRRGIGSIDGITWIELDLPTWKQFDFDSSNIDLVKLARAIENCIVKISVTVPEDKKDQVDVVAIEQVLANHARAWRPVKVKTIRQARARIQAKLSKQNPVEAIKAYISEYPPVNPEVVLEAAESCL